MVVSVPTFSHISHFYVLEISSYFEIFQSLLYSVSALVYDKVLN